MKINAHKDALKYEGDREYKRCPPLMMEWGAVMRILGMVMCLSYLALVTLLPKAPDEVPVRK